MRELPFADVKIHSELATARLAQGMQVDRFFQRGVLFNVVVSGGFLDGLSSEIYARSCSVGASFDCDIVLFDDNVDENHVEMIFKSSVFGPVMLVRALGPGVTVNGESLEKGSSTQYSALPQTISLNDIDLEIDPHKNAPKPLNPTIVNSWKIGRYGVLAALFLMLGFLVFDYRDFDFQLALNGQEPSYDLVVGHEADTTHLEVAITSVQEKLGELGLAEHVNARLDGSGAIDLSGILRSEKQQDWQDFRYWYDRSENPVLLSRVTVAPDLSDFPPIASIKLREPRKINLLNGTQLGVGDTISEGLTLVSIENDYLILNSRGENLAISFTGKEMNGG